jgi:hypothetical protein
MFDRCASCSESSNDHGGLQFLLCHRFSVRNREYDLRFGRRTLTKPQEGLTAHMHDINWGCNY